MLADYDESRGVRTVGSGHGRHPEIIERQEVMDIQEIIYEEGTQEKAFREKGSRGKKNKKTESQQKVTYDGIRKDPEIHLLIEKGNEMLGILGYTEHSVKHAAKVAETAAGILKDLGYGSHEMELAKDRRLYARHRQQHQPP